MLARGKMEVGIFAFVDTESLVPAEHLLRKIDAAVDFDKIYNMVESLYCADKGLPRAYKRPLTKSRHEWGKYVYDEHFNCIIAWNTKY